MIKKILRHSYLSALGSFKRPSNSYHILNGHFIYEEPNQFSEYQFDLLLNDLSKRYQFIKFQEAVNLISNLEVPAKPFIAFSFDDAFLECYTIIAPLLEKFDTNAAFFINPAVIDSTATFQKKFIQKKLCLNLSKHFMSWSQIMELHQRGHLIGNHTNDHIALKNLSKKDCERQVYEGKKAIESRLMNKCDYFALPFGTPVYFDEMGINAAVKYHKFIFTSSFNYNRYFYLSNKNIFGRRHFEGSWPLSHINYFLSQKRVY